MIFKREKKEIFHPTKEEYESKVIEDQLKELDSGRYETVITYINIIEDSLHKDKEEYLLSLIGNYNYDHIDEINNGYLYKKTKKLKLYKVVKEFVDGLTTVECEDNYYLFLVKRLFDLAKDDCEYYILQYLSNNDTKNIEFEFELSKEVRDLVPKTVPVTVAHDYYDPSKYKISYDPILDSKHIRFYNKFNDIIRVIQKIFTDIYELELWYQLSLRDDLEIQINYVNSNINDSARKLFISFSAVSLETRKRSVIIKESTIKLLESHFNKEFDDLINMSDDELTEYLSNSIKLKKTKN